MAAKKSAKKPKSRARKAAKVKNLPAKPLTGDDVRAVKGGDGSSSKISLDYKPRTSESLGGTVTYKYNLPTDA